MNSYNFALNKLKKNKILIKDEIVLIKNSLNRVLARDVKSPENYPHFLQEIPQLHPHQYNNPA